MATDLIHDAYPEIIGYHAFIDALVAACLVSMFEEDNSKKRHFIELHLVGRLRSEAANQVLNQYLQDFRPNFWEQHKDLLGRDLSRLRQLRNACAHGLLIAGNEPDEAFQILYKKRKRISDEEPEPITINKKTVEEAKDIYLRFQALVMNEIFPSRDE